MPDKQQLNLFIPNASAPSATQTVVVDAPPSTGRHDESPTSPALPKSKRLDLAVKRHLGEDTQVKVTDTTTVLLSSSRVKGRLKARVHQLFLDADDRVMNAVGLFLKSGDKSAGEVIDDYIDTQKHLLAMHVSSAGTPVGEHHNLTAIFEVLKARYFSDLDLQTDIVWGRYSRAKAKHSITLGTYDTRAKRITIHPALDQQRVPRTCVARVVHHEMCHIVHPAQTTTAGKRVVHTPAFRAEEAKYDDAEFADRWIQKHLESLLSFSGGDEKSLE